MPEGGVRGEAPYECPEDHTVSLILQDLNIPLEHCHLVLVNGHFIAPQQRDSLRLAAGDTLAVWPPVAGG